LSLTTVGFIATFPSLTFQTLTTAVAFSSFNDLFVRALYLRAHLREMSWVVVAQAAGVIGELASVKASVVLPSYAAATRA
jgi:hypothetical protein